MSIVGIRNSEWTLSGESAHYVIGLIIFFAVTFIALGGVYARSMARRLTWSGRKIHRILGIHKMGGRLMIILG
jgi:preprotein translocase subunit SecY